jgi:uncharacterized protein YbaR (Trm112 family)
MTYASRILFKSFQLIYRKSIEEASMKRWLMDILACPRSDCRNKLNLDVYRSHSVETDDESHEEIDEALITCPKCGRWYPVIDGIACMLPDDLRLQGRQKTEETGFLERWKDRLPANVVKGGIPFGLPSQT